MKRIFEKTLHFMKMRDELSLGNIRGEFWAALLIFPLSVIIGDLRYLDQEMSLFGVDSTTLLFMAYGLGWLIAMFSKERGIMVFLRASVVLQALLLPFMLLMGPGTQRLVVYIVFHAANGVSIACGFWLFAFLYNNVERLLSMVVVQIYYAGIYLFWDIDAVAGFLKTYGSVAIMLLLIVLCFIFKPAKHEAPETKEDGKASGVPAVLGADFTYYMTMLMLLWVEYDESYVLSFTFGLGAVFAVVLLIIIQLCMNKSALHIWNITLVFVLAGAAALLPGNPFFINAGSFLWGLGDGLGYVIVLYMLGCAVKRSRSHRMFRLCCAVAFAEYFVVTGAFDFAYAKLDYPNHYIAFTVVLGLCLICFALSPILQRKLFHADWTDALRGTDALREEHGETLNAVEHIDRTAELGLTPRETQVFTLLLTDASPKQIAADLKISYASVNFHTKNLYRKLNIQSRTELFALYSSYVTPKASLEIK